MTTFKKNLFTAITFLLAASVFHEANAQTFHESFAPVNNVSSTITTQTSTPTGAIGTPTLTLNYQTNGSGASIDVFSENNNLIQTFSVGRCVSNAQKVIQLEPDSIDNWAADGQISFHISYNTGIIGQICPHLYSLQADLDYDYCFDPQGALGNDTILCPGDTIMLGEPNIPGTFLWSTNDTTSAIYVTQPGIYSWEAQTACGQDSSGIIISSGLASLGADTGLCPGDSIILGIPNLPGSYTWTWGNNTDTSAAIAATEPGQYILNETNQCGSSADTITIFDGAVQASFTDSVQNLNVFFGATPGYQYSYDWDFGDGQTANGPHPSHTYDHADIYTVTLVVSNACGSDTMTKEIGLNTFGIQNIKTGKLSIHPNPSNGRVFIDFNSSKGTQAQIQVFTMEGRTVFNKTVILTGNHHQTSFQLKQPPGVYILRIKRQDRVINRKLIIAQ